MSADFLSHRRLSVYHRMPSACPSSCCRRRCMVVVSVAVTPLRLPHVSGYTVVDRILPPLSAYLYPHHRKRSPSPCNKGRLDLFLRIFYKPLSHGRAVTAPLQGSQEHFLLTLGRCSHRPKTFLPLRNSTIYIKVYELFFLTI